MRYRPRDDRIRRSLEERSAIRESIEKLAEITWWKLRGRGDKFNDEIGFGESLTGMVSKKSCNAAMIHQRGSVDPSKTISGRVGSSSGLPAFINHFVFSYGFDSRLFATRIFWEEGRRSSNFSASKKSQIIRREFIEKCFSIQRGKLVFIPSSLMTRTSLSSIRIMSNNKWNK